MRKLQEAFLAADVVVTGDVHLSPGVNLWYGTVIRGDLARITLGENVNIQDRCVVHTDFDVPLDVEPNVVVGHGAILHGVRVGAGCLIGMSATLLSRTDVGEESIIAAGTVLTEGTKVPPRSLVVGVPGQVIREVRDDERERIAEINRRYRLLAQRYVDGEIPFPYGSPEWEVPDVRQ